MNISFTTEQKSIISAEESLLLISAFSGTGKTTVLAEYARQRPYKKFLYLVFNEKMAKEAKTKFPDNTECRTLHSVAYQYIGYLYKHKLRSKITNYKIKEILMLDHSPQTVEICKELNEILNQYCYSNIEDINKFFNTIKFQNKKQLNTYFKILWNKITDIENEEPITHDIYFKLYINTNPDLPYDYLLLDEAQDSNKAIVNLLVQQIKKNKKVIMVGDTHQEIYSFRASYNVFDFIIPGKRMVLTQSFRFGEKIANVANILLNNLTNENKQLKGLNTIEDSINKIKKDETIAIINRTNAGSFNNAINSIKNNKKIYFIGNIERDLFIKLESILFLFLNELDKIKHQDIIKYNSYKDFKYYQEFNKDKETEYMINIVEKYQNNLPNIIQNIKNNTVKNINNADIILTTVHKSKGLEFEQVIIGNDFPDFLDKNDEIKFENIKKEEINILYVALTRAKRNVQINKSINDVIKIENNKKLKNMLKLN